MQGIIGDMRLPERVLLGKAFTGVMEMMEMPSSNGQDMGYQASLLTSKPDWVFVFVSCKNIDRADLHERMDWLCQGAMAHYDKSNCLLIVDRDGDGYEVALEKWTIPFTDAQRALGKLSFGKLRMGTKQVSLTRQ